MPLCVITAASVARGSPKIELLLNSLIWCVTHTIYQSRLLSSSCIHHMNSC